MADILFQILIYLGAAVIAVPLAARLGLGSVLGYLVAGIAIGPIFGLVGSETKDVQHVAEFGIVTMLFLIGLSLHPLAILGLILLCYLVLGCFLEGFAMLVLTMPIFFPIITQLGLDPIWFGVLVVLTLEMGLISPPVGVNVFIVKSVAPTVELGTIFRGVIPFWFAMLATLIILVAFPQISLILPNTMIN